MKYFKEQIRGHWYYYKSNGSDIWTCTNDKDLWHLYNREYIDSLGGINSFTKQFFSITEEDFFLEMI